MTESGTLPEFHGSRPEAKLTRVRAAAIIRGVHSKIA